MEVARVSLNVAGEEAMTECERSSLDAAAMHLGT
jgi:hypothetical protein